MSRWLALIVGLAISTLAVAQDSTERDLLRTRPDDDQRPWLTMNTGGHTASVQALAFLPDGKRLLSAGLDKVANVWDVTSALRDLRRTFLLERTLRWQVSRGLRGAVYALAVAPNDGLVALGGYGATGGLGEIVVVDPVTGRLVTVLNEHRQSIAGLVFSADGKWLASVDVEGRAIAWKRDGWQPTTITPVDRQLFGAPQADLIALMPKLRPIALTTHNDALHVTLPWYAGRADNGDLQWKLRHYRVDNPQQTVTSDTIHTGLVTALAASADGRRLVSADLVGNLHLFNAGEVNPAELTPGQTVLSLAITPDGNTLVAGTATAANVKPAQSEVQIWNVATRQITSRRSGTVNILACAVSADGQQIAHSGGTQHEIHVGRLSAFPGTIVLRGQGRGIVKVAFHQQDAYRIGFGTTLQPTRLNELGPIERSFDPTALELSGQPAVANEWRVIEPKLNGWELKLRKDRQFQLYRNDAPAGLIPLDRRLEGSLTCYAWITNDQGEPIAIAAGTDTQNSIFVFGLVNEGKCPLWRHYRGHHDRVTSLGVSRDGKYLVSGSIDTTIRLWSLSEIAAGPTLVSRWGAEFAVVNGQLQASRVHPAGPLFFNGVRTGDTLSKLTWFDGTQSQPLTTAAAMLPRLSDPPAGTQFTFELSRGDQPSVPFQRLPAWQPLAALFAGDQDEWALWTPEGYYDASANGHTLFGWHVNRGLDRMPDFYRADQFRRRLERPDVIERLLEAGSVAEAFKLAALAPPPAGDLAVQKQIAATPRIDILTPVAGQALAARTATVRARIEIAADQKLADARMFAGGVAAQFTRIVEQNAADGQQTLVYEWNARLPNEQRQLIQVLASTEEEAVGASSLVVDQPATETPAARPPRLYLLAVGINHYRDNAIQPLAYSVADAQSVVQLFEAQTDKLYAVDKPTLLVNEQVTPTHWRETFARLRERLADAQPDDLLVMFLAGHGFVDPTSGRYYFAGQTITRDDYLSGNHTSSIAWSDFQLLADVPCRKLALVDTCHSGAIQPLRWRHLKAAVRTFQQDQILTVTASAGHERSEEQAEWQHGAFTKTLLDGLSGRGDGNADGFVTLTELVDYVKSSVPTLTSGRQNPTAGPIDLLPFVSLRLTKAE